MNFKRIKNNFKKFKPKKTFFINDYEIFCIITKWFGVSCLLLDINPSFLVSNLGICLISPFKVVRLKKNSIGGTYWVFNWNITGVDSDKDHISEYCLSKFGNQLPEDPLLPILIN